MNLTDYKYKIDSEFNDEIADIVADLKKLDRDNLSIEKVVNGHAKLTNLTSDKIDAICERLQRLRDKAIIIDSLTKVGE
ncbi:hypothetical protein N6G94_10285 (plasmid) [Pediococcus inopinatus]|uniref:hypothetical protein n=1 Tax=Pediococcus inopinatus TaxID=114090 RepID=UPI002B2605FE|nr:hypothetical protein [Pediococcus inopinatus]WPC18492.1 hypothetical protein N6G94_10285 [Pediococcus inopinatus]